jgi:hypothetical protein
VTCTPGVPGVWISTQQRVLAVAKQGEHPHPDDVTQLVRRRLDDVDPRVGHLNEGFLMNELLERLSTEVRAPDAAQPVTASDMNHVTLQ